MKYLNTGIKGAMLIGVFAVASFVMSDITSTNVPSYANDPFVVNTVDDNDDGVCDSMHCSLREAIEAANAQINGTTEDGIIFQIWENPPFNIKLTKPLPKIIESVNIDGISDSLMDDLQNGVRITEIVIYD